MVKIFEFLQNKYNIKRQIHVGHFNLLILVRDQLHVRVRQSIIRTYEQKQIPKFCAFFTKIKRICGSSTCVSFEQVLLVSNSYIHDIYPRRGLNINGIYAQKQFTLEEGTKAQKGSRCIALLFLQPRRQMRVGGQRPAPAALPPGKTRYQLYRRLGGPQGRSRRMRKISPPPGFDPRTVQFLASRYTD